MSLTELTVIRTDLPAGFRELQHTCFSTPRQLAAVVYNLKASQLRAHGFEAACTASWLGAGQRIDSFTARFHTAAGAHWMYLQGRGSAMTNRSGHQPVAVPRVGNELTAVRHVLGGPFSPDLDITFREGRFTSRVHIAGRGGTVAEASHLLHRVDGRILHEA